MLDIYNKIWGKIKKKLNIIFHSKPAYDQKCLKAKVRELDSGIKTNFLGNEVPKENMHYTCIACVTIDSVMKMEKNYLQFYLEVKKIQMSRFINTALKSNSESDSEVESKSDTKLMTKLESNSDSE